MRKRIFSILLVWCMVISLLPIQALAANDADALPAQTEATEGEGTKDTEETKEAGESQKEGTGEAETAGENGETIESTEGGEAPSDEKTAPSDESSVDAEGETEDGMDSEDDSLDLDALGEGEEEPPFEMTEGAGEPQIITIQAPGAMAEAAPLSDEPIVRYTVLVLDCSGSMSGTPVARMKVAALRFCDQVLKAQGTNYVAVVPFSTSNHVACTFTSDYDVLDKAINGLRATGNTNLNAALVTADELLQTTQDAPNAKTVRNIVLLSDGVPQSGVRTEVGRYTSKDSSSYRYANTCYNTASGMWSRYSIYTLGFFHKLSGRNLEFARRLMIDLQNAGYYEVNDPNDLEFVFGEIAGDVTDPKGMIKRDFYFPGILIQDRDVKQTCYYSNTYFTKDAREYNSSLATMSLSFELSTWSSNDSTAEWTTNPLAVNPKFKNARDLLVGKLQRDDNGNVIYDSQTGALQVEKDTGLGFKDFMVQDYWGSQPGKDTIGVLAANKTVTLEDGTSFTLIAMGVRGGGYGQEWASNFTVGKEGDHTGFARARDDVLDFLADYVSDHQITGDIKLWLVGYSRAGAVANMVAGALDAGERTIPNVTIAPENLFAYTFEAPQGEYRTASEQIRLSQSGVYDNIHNIINLNDLVPLVAPSVWNFWRNNKDKPLPTELNGNYGVAFNKMLQEYRQFEGDTTYRIKSKVTQYKVKIDPWKFLPGGDPLFSTIPYEIYTSQALTDSATFLFGGVVESRDNYYYNLQDGVREILSLVYGGTLADLAKEGITLDEFIERFMNELTFERFYEIIKPMLSPNPFEGFDSRKEKVRENLDRFVKDVLADSDLWGTIRFAVNLPSTLSTLFWNLIESIIDDVWQNGISAPSVQSVYNLVVLGVEGGLLQAHYPEITFAWMTALDDNYNGTANMETSLGKRIVYINCPVDVSVYDSSGRLVASIANDEAQAVAGSYIPAYVNIDGAKVVVLPADNNYNISMKATGDGEVYYSINEYSYATMDTVRVVNYEPVDVKTGEELKGVVPALTSAEQNEGIPNGSNAEYVLYNTDNRPVDYQQAADPSVKYTVSVAAEDSGYVTGGGSYTEGNFAEVSAYPMAGGSLVGWYDQDNNLVSTDDTYRFPIHKDVKLTARFAKVETYQLTVVAQTGGTVSNETIQLPAGAQVKMEATPKSGYKFSRWTAASGVFENSASANTWFTMPAQSVEVTAVFSSEGGGTSTTPSTPRGGSGGSGTRGTSTSIEIQTDGHGTVTATPKNTSTGGKITLTVRPYAGYVLDTLTARGSSKDIELTEEDDATYTFIKPAGSVIVSATFASDGTQPEPSANQEFLDVPSSHWAYTEIRWALENGVMNGTGNGMFSPDNRVTRQQTWMVLGRMAGANPVDMAAARNWASDNSISDGSNPGNSLTRQQLVALLYRYAQSKNYATSDGTDINRYPDHDAVSSYAGEAMAWAVGNGIIGGTADGRLNPTGTATRAQFAVIVYRFSQKVLS